MKAEVLFCSLLYLQLPGLYWHIADAPGRVAGWMNEFININCPPNSLCLRCSLSSSFTQLTTGALRLLPSSKLPSWNPQDNRMHVPSTRWSSTVNILALTKAGFSITRLLETLCLLLSLPPSSVPAHRRHSVPTVGWVDEWNEGIFS